MRVLQVLPFLFAQALQTSSAWVIHVDLTSGSDDLAVADGSHARPFRTLAGWEAARSRGAPATTGINFGPGIHDVVATGGLVLDIPGTVDAPFVVSGAGAGQTVLTAGGRVQGFAEETNGTVRIWTATMPANTTYFRQLFVRPASTGTAGANFSRRVTARSATMQYDHADQSNPKFAIVYQPGQVAPAYHNQADVLATLYHCWTATTHHIDSINATTRVLTLLQSPHVDIPRCEHASGKRFSIEDAFEELDQPGEFYYDRQSGQLSYLPLPSEQVCACVRGVCVFHTVGCRERGIQRC